LSREVIGIVKLRGVFPSVARLFGGERGRGRGEGAGV
jgi:hypothetical protein